VSETGRTRFRFVGPAAALLVAAQIAAAVIGIRAAASLTFRSRAIPVIPAAQRRDIRFIHRWIPDDEPLLFLSDGSDPWTPRTWERALSPEPVAFLLTTEPPRATTVLRRRFHIRWAISAGTPPPDPGFAWHRRLAPIPGSSTQYWFGRLSD
jgi:hypothetical protein